MKGTGIGTHSELLKKCEVYQQIAASQLSESELKAGRKDAEEQTAANPSDSREEVPNHA